VTCPLGGGYSIQLSYGDFARQYNPLPAPARKRPPPQAGQPRGRGTHAGVGWILTPATRGFARWRSGSARMEVLTILITAIAPPVENAVPTMAKSSRANGVVAGAFGITTMTIDWSRDRP
jgi:hypothetical protein